MPFAETIIGPCRLIHGDALTVLPEIAGDSYECVVTDPPYGIGHDAANKLRHSPGTTKMSASWHGKSIHGDRDTSVRDAVLAVIDWRQKQGAVFAHWSRPVVSPEPHGRLIWNKPHLGLPRWGVAFRHSYEDIWLVGKWKFHGIPMGGVLTPSCVEPNESRGRMHPHEKPIDLLEAIIGRSMAATVMDPFMGSGTTAAACIRTKRQFIGIEIDKRHFENACRRVEKEWNRERSKLPFTASERPRQLELV